MFVGLEASTQTTREVTINALYSKTGKPTWYIYVVGGFSHNMTHVHINVAGESRHHVADLRSCVATSDAILPWRRVLLARWLFRVRVIPAFVARVSEPHIARLVAPARFVTALRRRVLGRVVVTLSSFGTVRCKSFICNSQLDTWRMLSQY
jgi:hypothetical protein